MSENIQAEENEWGDVAMVDTLISPVMKWGGVAGFGLLAIARIVTAIIAISETAANTTDGTFVTLLVFQLLDLLGVLVLTGALALPGLFNPSMKDWARVTLLSVAMVALAGSSAFSLLLFSLSMF